MFAVGDNVLFSRSGAIHAGRVHSLGPKGMCKVMVGGHLVSMFEGQLSLDYKRGPRLAPEVDAHQEAMMNKEFDEELALTYSLARKLNIERDEARKANAAIQSREAELVLAMDRISKRAEAIRCELVEKEKQLKTRPTPETLEFYLNAKGDTLDKFWDAINKCEELERERNELREELARIQTMAASVADVLAKHEVMIDAIRLAHDALRNLILAKRGGMQPANALIDATSQGNDAVKKLKPFLP